MEAKMCDEQVLKFCKIITQLKDKLKCTICLDVIQDTAELECGHKFCHGCYSDYKSNKKQTCCPLCKAVVRRRSIIYKDEYADKLGLYVTKVSDMFKGTSGFDVERMAQTPSGTVYKTKNTKINIDEEKPSTSKSKSKGKVKSSSKDAFNKLANKSPENLFVNKKGTQKIYHNKKKQKEEKTDLGYKILDFGDNEYKCAVLRWLNDTRNKFERMTQTQSVAPETDDNISTTDLVSVSQIRQNESIPQISRSVRYRQRARSLDIEMKKKVKVKKKILDGSCIDMTENYVIEDADTEEEKIVKKVEENVLLNIIEDQYLDKLEKEIMNELDFATPQKSPPKEAQNSQPSTSGWERMGKIKKTLRKKEKAPKKLNITVKSSQTSNTNVAKGKIDRSIEISKNVGRAELPPAEKQSPINLKTIETPEQKNQAKTHSDTLRTSDSLEVKVQSTLPPEIQDRQSKLYDLDAIETYITENIEIIEKEDSFNVANMSDQSRNVSDKDDNYSNKENNENIINIEPVKGKILVLDNVLVNKCRDEPSEKEIEDPYLLPTQKLNTSKYSKFDKDHNKENIGDNNPFLMLTQENDIDKKATDVFLNPTQKWNNNEIYNYMDCTTVEGKYESIKDIFTTLQDNLKYCNENVNSEKVRKKLDIMARCVSKLQEITLNKTPDTIPGALENTPLREFSEKGNQTSVNTQTKHVQTEIYEFINREVQTENFIDDQLILDPSGSSKKSDKNPFTQNTAKALKTLSESVVNFDERPPVGDYSKQTQSNPTTQNNFFSATLDNFCFETQDITRENDKSKDPPEAPTEPPPQEQESKSLKEPDDEGDIRTSLLVCSLNSGASNRVNRKLTYHDSVGSKRTLSDSDEEVIKPKKLCNRFIRDDLSIEFDVNTETQNTQNKKDDSKVLLPDSDSVDYEDYLDKVMKKYEDNDVSISTPEKKDGSQPTTKRSSKNNETIVPEDNNKSKLERVLTNCDEIIARVNENINRMSKHNDTSRSSYRTASESSDKSCKDDDLHEVVDIKADGLLRGQTESSDIIGETESMEPLPKRARRTNHLDVGFDQGEVSFSSPNLLAIANNNEKPNVVFPELYDSLDDEQFANIDIAEEKQVQDDARHAEMNEERHVTQEVNEEDLFSDDDIVETTPQKASSLVERRSQPINASSLPLPLTVDPMTSAEIIDNFNFDFAPLPPPLDFQDNPQQTDKDDTESSHHITVIELDRTVKDKAQSLTPDGLQTYENKETVASLNRSKVKSDLFGKDRLHSLTPQRLSQLNISTKRVNSTQLSQASVTSCDLSPITGVRSGIEQAHTSTHSPLTISTQSARKRNILTSTPKQKSIWNYITSQGEPAKSKPCIACTRLSKEKTQSISLLTNRKLATYSQVFDKSVTHMIVTVTENNWIKDYTMKFVAAVAAGIWILNFEWVQECLSTNSIVPEEPYEVLDDTGMAGPKTARLSRKENPLLKGFKLYCANSLFTTSKADVEEVIKMLEGKVVPSLDKLTEKDGKVGLIITEGRSTQDFEVYETWLDLYKTVTVDIEWLSKSVGRYKLLSIRPYVWCSDDHLDDLGYPPHLTEMVQSSSSEQY